MKTRSNRKLFVSGAALYVLMVACDQRRSQAGESLSGVPGISIGMTRSQVLSTRPDIYDNSGDLEEVLGPRQKAFFVFAGDLSELSSVSSDRLVAVVVSRTFARGDTLALKSRIDSIIDIWTRRAGKPVRHAGELPPGLQMLSWTPPEARIILIHDANSHSSPAQTHEVSTIFQARELPPGALLPQRIAQPNHRPPARDVSDTSTIVEHLTQDSVEPGGFVDRREEINPAPGEITQRRFAILHSEISKVRTLQGRIPDAIEEILSRPESDANLKPQSRWLLDGWNRPIHYRARRPYELRSAGADGVVGTADDLISREPN